MVATAQQFIKSTSKNEKKHGINQYVKFHFILHMHFF